MIVRLNAYLVLCGSQSWSFIVILLLFPDNLMTTK